MLKERDLTLLFIRPGRSLLAYSKNSNGTTTAHSVGLSNDQSTSKTLQTIALIQGLPFAEPIRQRVGPWELQIEPATKEGIESIQFSKNMGVSIDSFKDLTHFCIVRPVVASREQ